MFHSVLQTNLAISDRQVNWFRFFRKHDIKQDIKETFVMRIAYSDPEI